MASKFNSASPKKVDGNRMQAFSFMNRLGQKKDDDDESVADNGIATAMLGLRRTTTSVNNSRVRDDSLLNTKGTS